ncbi:hypothetical protein GCM10027276_05270 [Comamonas piscis]
MLNKLGDGASIIHRTVHVQKGPNMSKRFSYTRSGPQCFRCATAGMVLAVTAPYALAADCVDQKNYMGASSCTVPSGMNVVSLRLDGAGGGAGGSASVMPGTDPKGGNGGKGATVWGAMQVSPDAVLQLVAGTGGLPGGDGETALGAGGPGGLGEGGGGMGGDGGQGGGGGGGGGASSLAIAETSVWIRAGGGGGGGGGGTALAHDGVSENKALTLTTLCMSAAPSGGNGGTANPGAADRAGGGGGNGGTFATAPTTLLQAVAGMPPAQGAGGGFSGDSCYSARGEFMEFTVEGNSEGGFPGGSLAQSGGISLTFSFVPERTAQISAINAMGATVQAPVDMPPGYAVSEYRVSCVGSAGDRVAGTAPGPTPTAHVPMALPDSQTWTCTLDASLTDTITGDALKTLPTQRQSSPS